MADPKSTRPTYATDFIAGQRPDGVFFENPMIDHLVHAVMALGAEVWTLRRRAKITERLLAAKHVVTSEMIETYVPTADEEKAWGEERNQLIKSAFGPMATTGQKSPESQKN